MEEFLIQCEKGNLTFLNQMQHIPTKKYLFRGCIIACETGHLDILQWLVSKGADIREWNDFCLRVACMRSQIEIVQFLIQNGADIYRKAKYTGSTALDIALMYEDWKILTYFLNLGVDYKLSTHSLVLDKAIKAQKKIYFWWIQICYDHRRKVGQRMMEKSWQKYLFLKNNFF